MALDEHRHALTPALSVRPVRQDLAATGSEQSARVVDHRVVHAIRTECAEDVVGMNDQPPADPSGDATMLCDVLGDVAQFRERLLRDRFGEDVEDPATRQADGKCVVIGDAVAM